MATIVSSGSLTRIGGQAPVVDRSLWLTAQQVATYEHLWKVQPQIRTVVGFLSRNIAQLKMHVYKRISDTDRQRQHDHPLASLLSRPNPWMTQYRFWQAVVADMAIYDNSVWMKVQPQSGQDLAAGHMLVRIPVSLVEPKGENLFYPDYYEIQGKSGPEQIKPESILHFRGYNPLDDRWGVSPLEALRQILSEEAAASEYRESFWNTGARLSGVIERPVEAPVWSTTAKNRFRLGWQNSFAGNGDYVGGTAILEDGMTFKETSVTAKDAQYLESRKLTREEVAAVYFIPPPMVGILDRATFSNIDTQHRMLYSDTFGPWLANITQEFELQVFPDFDIVDEYVEFNIEEKLRGSFEEQAEALNKATGGRAWMTPDEARARANLPEMGGDSSRLITPLNVRVDGVDSGEVTLEDEES